MRSGELPDAVVLTIEAAQLALYIVDHTGSSTATDDGIHPTPNGGPVRSVDDADVAHVEVGGDAQRRRGDLLVGGMERPQRGAVKPFDVDAVGQL